MARRKKQQPATTETEKGDAARAKVRGMIGGNVPPEVLKKHFAEIGRLETAQKAANQALSTAWKAAESDGIAKKPAKLVFKLFKDDPATADAVLRSVQTYATQLGLFDRIDEWKQAEQHEANGASIARAESDVKKSAPNGGDPKSGGRDEAIYAQGFQAGEDGAARTSCPQFVETDDADTWHRGWRAGAMRRVDAANSAHASASA